MSISAAELAKRLRSDDAAARHAALSFIRSRDCVGELLAIVVAALEDDGSFQEESYDWSGPAGYAYTVRVSDAASELIERVGLPAVDVLVAALECGAGARTRTVAAELVIGREAALSDETAARLSAVVEPLVGTCVHAARLHRRLGWELERRAGLGAGDARLTQLETLLKGKDRELRVDAVWALGHAKGSRRAAEILLEQVSRTVPGIGDALSAVGPVLDDEGVGRLAKAIMPNRGDAALRAAAAVYRDARVARSLVKWLEMHPKNQHATAVLLAEMGDAASSMRPHLAGLLVCDDWQLRSLAWTALRAPDGLRDAEKDAFIELQRVLLEGDARIDHRLLMELGPRASTLVGVLMARLESAQSHERAGLMNVLSTMGDAARPVVPYLVRHLSSHRGAHTALTALARLGPVAVEAREAVEELLAQTRDGRLRTAAENALASFESSP